MGGPRKPTRCDPGNGSVTTRCSNGHICTAGEAPNRCCLHWTCYMWRPHKDPATGTWTFAHPRPHPMCRQPSQPWLPPDCGPEWDPTNFMPGQLLDLETRQPIYDVTTRPLTHWGYPCYRSHHQHLGDGGPGCVETIVEVEYSWHAGLAYYAHISNWETFHALM